MKLKIILIIVILITAFNCTLHLGEFNSPEDIMNWVYKNIKYKTNQTSTQTPDETLQRGSGDCDDMTWLFADMCAKYLNIYPYCVVMESKICDILHAVAIINNKYYDCTINTIFTKEELKVHYKNFKVYEFYEFHLITSPYF